MADNVLVKIDEQVKGNRVIVYMKGKPNFPQCGFSAHTVEILQSYGYPLETVDVLEDPARHQRGDQAIFELAYYSADVCKRQIYRRLRYCPRDARAG